MKTELIEYSHNGVTFEAYIAHDDKPSKKPAVLIVHDWSGKNEHACKRAERLAELGYVGIAIDMFGKGKLGKTNEEKTALITPLVSDRALLLQRLLAALEMAKKINEVDTHKIAIMGFCFGGLCALDLARSGADILGAVSFHGLFIAPNLPKQQIKAKILALHGYADPMVKPEQVMEFANEMTEAKADWQIHMYGNTMHAFTNKLANDPGFGTVYCEKADQRSWIAMKDFFAEIFA